MTDIYGAEPLPATDGLTEDWRKGQRAPDRALDAITSYLKAVLPARVGALWEQIAPGEQLIAETFTTRPQDVLVAPRQLPAIFLWRGRFTQTREAEDYLVTRTQLGCLWLLWWPNAIKRERYLPFQGTLTKAIHETLSRGRNPAWVVPGDTAEGASERGSVLLQQAGLLEPIRDITGDQVDVSLDPEGSGQAVRYKAISLTIQIAERMVRDPALFSVPTISTSDPGNAQPGYPQPAALDLTVAQGGENTTQQLQPAP